MAQFTRANGDFQPVLRLDSTSYTNGGVNVATTGVTVQPQGPKLDYWTITAAGALTPADLKVGFDIIQNKATIYIYEYTDAASDLLAIAVYPTAAYDAATLQVDVRLGLNGWVGCTAASGAEFSGLAQA